MHKKANALTQGPREEQIYNDNGLPTLSSFIKRQTLWTQSPREEQIHNEEGSPTLSTYGK